MFSFSFHYINHYFESLITFMKLFVALIIIIIMLQSLEIEGNSDHISNQDHQEKHSESWNSTDPNGQEAVKVFNRVENQIKNAFNGNVFAPDEVLIDGTNFATIQNGIYWKLIGILELANSQQLEYYNYEAIIHEIFANDNGNNNSSDYRLISLKYEEDDDDEGDADK